MAFTKENRILIKNLFALKGYNESQRVSLQRLERRQRPQVVAKSTGYRLSEPYFQLSGI